MRLKAGRIRVIMASVWLVCFATMKGNILEAVIGAVVLVVASFFMYFAYVSSGDKIKEGYVVFARFDDVTGLASGADIKMNGIKIGIVKELKIDENYQAVANFLIKNGVNIPDDSSAAISTDGIIGSKFVSIEPGFSENLLKEGDRISMTRSSVNLERLIDKFVVSSDSSKSEK